MIPVYIHKLGEDPDTKHRLNAWSYQQNAATSFRGWQYVAFYRRKSQRARHVVICRRKLTDSSWKSIELEDYDQTTEDGHNTISIGICRGDGTIHLSFDHHCDHLRYRHSKQEVALHPQKYAWEASLFGPVLEKLGGSGLAPFPVTYPRFVNAGDNLLLEFRIGK